MTERQYRVSLANRRLRLAQPLLADDLGAELLRRAAAAVRRCEAAREVWEELATPAQQRAARVAGFEGGVLTIQTDTWALCAQLRAGRLGREIVRRCPGVASVRFVPVGSDAGTEEQYEQHR